MPWKQLQGARPIVRNFSTAYYLLEGLNEIGIDYLFCNFGTDHAPIIEEMAHRRKRGEPLPKIVRCPHENTAAHMAGGYALVTGRGQGVLVHVDVGTANTATPMHNMFRSRAAGAADGRQGALHHRTTSSSARATPTCTSCRSRSTRRSLVRPYVKWEWTLPSGVVVKEALRRAHSIMQSEPQGPGLSDDAAGDADAALERRRNPPLSPPNSSARTRGGGADPRAGAAARGSAARGAKTRS